MRYNPKLHLKWYAIDLDGTLAMTSPPDYELRDAIPNRDMIEACEQVVKNGYKIVVHTSRHWQDYAEIEAWLNKWKIAYKHIICGKPLVKMIVDDKAISPREFIKSIKSHGKRV